MSKHAAIWIDHKEARIFHVTPDKADEMTVTAPQHVHNKHPKGPEGAKEHPDDAKRFFHEVARSLEGTEEILIVGPSTAKLDFIRYVHKHDHALEPKIVGVESVDHPSDGQLIAYAKKYFHLRNRIV
ncbi:MAG: translational machinery protein [Myxococcota bacterium]|nr:translational machinery protein [Myxococcota bacterium]